MEVHKTNKLHIKLTILTLTDGLKPIHVIHNLHTIFLKRQLKLHTKRNYSKKEGPVCKAYIKIFKKK